MIARVGCVSCFAMTSSELARLVSISHDLRKSNRPQHDVTRLQDESIRFNLLNTTKHVSNPTLNTTHIQFQQDCKKTQFYLIYLIRKRESKPT